MSFIQFESGREKDKMREELREARNDLLKQVSGSVVRVIFTTMSNFRLIH